MKRDEFRDELAAIPPDRRRSLSEFRAGAAPYLEIDGQRVINLASNNYLSLANHPKVIEESVRATREDGAGVGSSRLIEGTTPRVARLEERLAAMKRTDRALVMTSGFSASLALFAALFSKEDGVAIEKGAHASLVAGARLCGAKIAVFRRDVPDSLARAIRALRKKRARRIVAAMDALHSMDGDIIDLPRLREEACALEAYFLLDDAHATGVLGPDGRGTFAHFDLEPGSRDIQIGTLSKALGSQGGFVAASSSIIEKIIQSSPPFIYTTGIIPAAVGAAHGALDLLASEPDRIARLRENIAVFRRIVGAKEIPSPVVPLVVGADSAMLVWKGKFKDAGALVAGIRPPTVPEGTARLRFSIQSDHRILVEGTNHSAEERYLILARACAAEQIADPA